MSMNDSGDCYSGSGSSNSSGNSTSTMNMCVVTEIPIPDAKHLPVIFVAVAAAVIALAVVVVVISVIVHRIRQQRAKLYYTYAKTLTIQPMGSSESRESIRSNSAVLDLRHDQLREGRGSAELVLTQETSAYSEEPSLTVSSSTIPRVQQTSDRASSKQRDIHNNQMTAVERASETEGDKFVKEKRIPVQAEGTGKNTLSAEKSKTQQFSFEDGTPLQDYPVSVDLEVAGKDEEPKRANIMGYPDIYSSQILLTLPSEDTTPEKREESQNSAHPRKRLQRLPAVERSAVPAKLVESNIRRPISKPPRPQSELLPLPSPDMREVEHFLNQSLNDLLEMTQALGEEADDNCRDTTATDEPIFKHGSSKRPDQQTIQRQGSSLPSLLDTTPAPPSHQNPVSLPPPPSAALTARASRGSASEVRTPGGLEPEPPRTLLCSDEITELQISHV